MSEPIRFDDGAAYERYMGVWSRAVGEVFLDWLAAPPGLRWLDVGCGNGAFTAQAETLRGRLRARLGSLPDGRIRCVAVANAVKGCRAQAAPAGGESSGGMGT